jgi:phenylacetate-CoA ligase
VPFYRDLAKTGKIDPGQIFSIHDLREFPVIMESDLRSNFNNFLSDLSENVDYVSMALSRKYSETFYMPVDETTLISDRALLARHYENAGYSIGSPVLCFVNTIEGSDDEKYRFDKANNRYYFAANHLDRKNLAYYCGKIKDSRAGFIIGYPSALEVFADHVLEWEIDLSFQGVITSGEVLNNVVRYKIEKAFDAKVYDLYHRSFPIIGMGQCHYCDGYHLFSEYCIVELLDFDGNTIEEEGKVGRIVATNISNRILPIIRFDTGDLGVYDGNNCECGRGMPKMVRKIVGSQKELLISADGRYVPPGTLQAIFSEYGYPAARYQLVQNNRNKFKLKLVRGPEYKSDSLEKIKNNLRERLGGDSDITIEPVDVIGGEGEKKESILREYDPQRK